MPKHEEPADNSRAEPCGRTDSVIARAWSHINSLLRKHSIRHLNVEKGSNGRILTKECNTKLQREYPHATYQDLMVWIRVWLTRLDENERKRADQQENKTRIEQSYLSKDLNRILLTTTYPTEVNTSNKRRRSERRTGQKREEVVDLCSDDDIQNDSEVAAESSEIETFDFAQVLSTSDLMVHDDELGDVHLKDYADHIDGKLDKVIIKKIEPDVLSSDSSSSVEQVFTEINENAVDCNEQSKTTEPKHVIRVRKDLCDDSTTFEEKAHCSHSKPAGLASVVSCEKPPKILVYINKRKLAVGAMAAGEPPAKLCDSTSEMALSVSASSPPTKRRISNTRHNLGEHLMAALEMPDQDVLENDLPDTTAYKPTVQQPIKEVDLTEDAKPILHISNVLGLLGCVESYAQWQRNAEACVLVEQLRSSLQRAEMDTLKEKSTRH